MSDFDFKYEGFKVSGFAHLYKALDGLTQIQKSIGLSPLLERALEPMRDVAAAIAPDDPKTGSPWDLGDSIIVSTRQRTGASKSDRALGRYAARAYVGPNRFGYPQAMMMEFGTKYVLPQPYMRPAYDAVKRKSLEIIKEGWADQVMHTARLFAVKSSG